MDFNGGVQLVYELRRDMLGDMGLTESDVTDRMDKSRARLRERIVAFHSEETKVAILGKDRILVEVPGVQDIQQVKKEIGKPQYLTIRGVLDRAEDTAAASRTRPGAQSGTWYDLPFRLGGGSVKLSEPGTRGEHIEVSRFQPIGPLGEGRFGFVLPLSEKGQELCAAFTTEFFDKEICILLDNRVQDLLWVQARNIREPQITTGSPSDARRLKKLLESGPLPLPFELVQERAVSPVLAAMQQSSLSALTTGVVILLCFFGFNYLHRPYFLLVALLAVALEVGLFVIVANKHWIRISLPQLAGLALLIGMSADAFILVFEHVEKELETGTWKDALKASQKAFKTEIGVIFWAGTTTVLTLGGLYFVEGILSEYFILLALGVAISMSAAIYLRLLMSADPLLRLTHWVSRKKPFAPWVPALRVFDLAKYSSHMTRFYKVGVPIALVVIVVWIAAGWVNLGIDFSGGAQLVVSTEKEVSPEHVRKIADEVFGAACEVQFSPAERHYSIRVATVVETLASRGKDTADGVTAVGSGAPATTDSPGAGSHLAIVPVETRLLERIEKDLGTKTSLIEVELLGQSAALDNTISSLGNAAWGLIVLFVLCALLYISLRVPFLIVLALFCDCALVMAAVLVIGLPVDYPMIAAFLTFAGYSINDSIVVCHEIRAIGKPHMPEMIRSTDPQLAVLVQEAITKGLQHLTSRVFLTSFTTMLTMVPLLFCDGVLRTFGVIFVLGTAVGTLSSVYVVGINARDVVMGDTQVVSR
jgi:SecD/SecF fusion protein